jgi:hypothetical protein
LYLFSIFALGERKNGKRKKEKYHSAEGKTSLPKVKRGSVAFIPKDPSPMQTHYEDLVKRLDEIQRQLRALQPAPSDQ